LNTFVGSFIQNAVNNFEIIIGPCELENSQHLELGNCL